MAFGRRLHLACVGLDGRTLAYGKLEIQGRVRDGLVVDPGVKWIVVRMLARGRYVRYCDVRRAGDWGLLRASLRCMCQIPSWWSFRGSGVLLMLLLRGIAGRSFPRSGKTGAPPNVCAALLLVGQPGLLALLVRAPEAAHRAAPP